MPSPPSCVSFYRAGPKGRRWEGDCSLSTWSHEDDVGLQTPWKASFLLSEKARRGVAPPLTADSYMPSPLLRTQPLPAKAKAHVPPHLHYGYSPEISLLAFHHLSVLLSLKQKSHTFADNSSIIPACL